MIDRITDSYLTQFSKKFSLDDDICENTKFEHFVNYIILEKKLDRSFDVNILDDVHIGKEATIGIDGFCILINKKLITEKEHIDDFIDSKMELKAELFFIQTKTSEKFSKKDIDNFGSAVEDFISREPAYEWSSQGKKYIDLFNYLISHSDKLEGAPTCYIYYCTLGNYEGVKTIEATKNKIIKDLKREGVFSNFNFNFLDRYKIQEYYKRTVKKISRKFDFPSRTLIPEIDNVKEAYIGLVKAKVIIDLIEEEGEILSEVFYDNVRDYQGNNDINKKIRETLEDIELKKSFSILNNGITIIAEESSSTRDSFVIKNYQIINGLQTSRVLREAKEKLDDEIYVPLKLIITNDEKIIAKIIRTTNSQTGITELDLIAYTEFQRKIEDFFNAVKMPRKLYYERRSKQYNEKNIPNSDIVTKDDLIRCMSSLYFQEPHNATRYFGKLFNKMSDHIFNDKDEIEPYYIAAFIYKKLESIIRKKKEYKKYQKLRYFILMMFSLELEINIGKTFQGKKIKEECSRILELDLLRNDEKFYEVLDRVIDKINSLGVDLDDQDLSKQSSLVDKIKDLYMKNKGAVLDN